MSDIAHLAATIFRQAAGRERFMVAIAGPPGAGKSTTGERLRELLSDAPAALVPMDGFHLDNRILNERGHRARKGAPDTFDFGGLKAMLERLKTGGGDIAVPLFDRDEDFARGSASIVRASDRIVLVEGNYLLLDEAPWNELAALFDFTVFLDVPRGPLAHRLVQRWISHGLSEEEARQRAFTNDMPNAERVISAMIAPDVTIRFEE
jgi:pantothenate kinase